MCTGRHVHGGFTSVFTGLHVDEVSVLAYSSAYRRVEDGTDKMSQVQGGARTA